MAGSQLHLCYRSEAERNCRLWHAKPHSYSNCFSTSDRARLTGIQASLGCVITLKENSILYCLIMTIRFLTSYQWSPFKLPVLYYSFCKFCKSRYLILCIHIQGYLGCLQAPPLPSLYYSPRKRDTTFCIIETHTPIWSQVANLIFLFDTHLAKLHTPVIAH